MLYKNLVKFSEKISEHQLVNKEIIEKLQIDEDIYDLNLIFVASLRTILKRLPDNERNKITSVGVKLFENMNQVIDSNFNNRVLSKLAITKKRG